MELNFKSFSKINKIAEIFIISILAMSLLMEFFDWYKYRDIEKQLNIFNVLIISIFILSLWFENKFTTIILIVFNILFWYYNITERKDLSWYQNPFNHYDGNLISFANNFKPLVRVILYYLINPLPLINNILIWMIISFRIYKFYFYKNVTT